MKKTILFFFFTFIQAVFVQQIFAAESPFSVQDFAHIADNTLKELTMHLQTKNPLIMVYPGKKAIQHDFTSGDALYIPCTNKKAYFDGFALKKDNDKCIIEQHFNGPRSVLEKLGNGRSMLLEKLLASGRFTGLCTRTEHNGVLIEWCGNTADHTQGKFHVTVPLDPKTTAILARRILEILPKKRAAFPYHHDPLPSKL